MSNRDNRHHLSICFALGLVTLGLFLPVAGFEFLNYDDPEYVINNGPVTGGLTSRGIVWALTAGYYGHWHPVTWISHMLDFELYGLNPAGHHVTNLLLHVANTVLLFLVFSRMTGKTWPSAFIAALFAWHPLHVEPIAWVSSRKDLLSGLFMLLCLGSYLRYVDKPGTGRFLLTLLFFELGLMSKAMLVTLPFLLLLFDYWPLRRNTVSDSNSGEVKDENPQRTPVSWSRLALEKAPFLVLAGLSSVAAYWAEHTSGLVMASGLLPLHVRVSNAIVSYVRYLGKTLWPQDLSAMYPYPDGWTLLQVGGSAVLLLFISGLVFWQRRQRPWLFVGWFWYLGTFVPVIGIILTGLHGIADRYTYIPLIGIFIMAAWGGADLLSRRPGLALPLKGVATAIVVACIGVSVVQLQYWRNSIEVFSHASAVTSNNIRAGYNLAEALAKRGRVDEAIVQYRKTFEMRPNPLEAHFNYQAEGHNNLGIILGQRGDMEAAASEFSAAIDIKPAFPMAQHNLASALRYLGRLDEAVAHYEVALAGNPEDPLTLHNLGLALAERGDFPRARTNYEKILLRSPGDVATRNDLGLAYAGESNGQAAIESFSAALQLQPRFSEGYLNLGNVLADNGRAGEAEGQFNTARVLEPGMQQRLIEEANSLAAHKRLGPAADKFKSALRLGPVQTGVHCSFATVLANQGKLEAAIDQFKTAVRLSPDDFSAHYGLALALVMSGQAEAGVLEYREALRINPNAPDALNDLAWILATNTRDALRNGNEAVRMAEHACQLTQRREARFLGTLDAAYAEAGRFPEAISTAQEAQKVAVSQGQSEVAQAAEKRMVLYREGRAYRTQ